VKARPSQLPRVDRFWGDRIWGRLLFSPGRGAIPCAKRRLEVAVGNASVELWLEECGPKEAQPKLVVLRLLGARGRAELATLDPARFLPSIHSVVASINSSGFGGTRGNCELSRYFAGLGAAYDAVVAQYPSAAIWIQGKSIGGLGALYLAATRPPRAIVIRNVVDVSGIAAARAERFARAIIPEALDARRWAALARCPALFVVSGDDRLAKPVTQQEAIEAYGGPKNVLKVRGSHDDRELTPVDVPRYAEAVARLWCGS
jgi:pimeloyl-ACP methyl ester carboxylesterase